MVDPLGLLGRLHLGQPVTCATSATEMKWKLPFLARVINVAIDLLNLVFVWRSNAPQHTAAHGVL